VATYYILECFFAFACYNLSVLSFSSSTGRYGCAPKNDRGKTRGREALRLSALQRQRSGQEYGCPEEVPQMRRGEILLPGALQPRLGSAQAAVPDHKVEGGDRGAVLDGVKNIHKL
jgi:hypothetical protein